MWQSMAIGFFGAAMSTLVATEVLRSVVHAKRKGKDGLGGTQDIAMWGTFLSLLLAVVSIFSTFCWLLSLFFQ